jgi:hypothetical protein
VVVNKPINRAICAGLSPLLNLCASGLLPKGATVHFFIWKNTYDPLRYRSVYDAELIWAKEITSFYNCNLVLEGPHEWSCPPIEERSRGNKISFSALDFLIKDGDVVTANVIRFLGSNLFRRRVSIFPEGASCFNELIGEDKIWSGYLRPKLARCKCIITRQCFSVINKWLLPDKDFIVQKKFDHKKKYKVLDYYVLEKNRLEFKNYLIKKYKYQQIDYSHCSYFHPVIDELSFDDYLLFVGAMRTIIGNNTVLLKKHPRDNREYEELFSQLKHEIIPDPFSALPAELFIAPDNMKFIGTYTSVLLGFSRKKRIILDLPNRKVNNLYLEEYRGLRSVVLPFATGVTPKTTCVCNG